MNALNPQSVKIQKTPKQIEHKFVCGCSRSYQSYAALRLHVKRRHNSVMPPNAIIIKPVRPALETAVLPGRPSKPKKDVDCLDDADEAAEIAQNDLLSFLGENLMITKDLGKKMPLESVVAEISHLSNGGQDKWFAEIQEETIKILDEYKQKNMKVMHLDLDEDLVNLDLENPRKIVAWFLVWLMEIYVQIELVSDITFIFSRIWKVLDDESLGAEDLDNKLVWKKVMKECEDINAKMMTFRKDPMLLYNFIQKSCQLIGKIVEGKQTPKHEFS